VRHGFEPVAVVKIAALPAKCLLPAVLLSLAGCAIHHEPYVAYAGTRPLSDTAVLSAIEEHHQIGTEPRITFVDGVATSAAVGSTGSPQWVRVASGAHRFRVHYWELDGHIVHNADIDVDMPSMRPGHVYVLRFQRTSIGVSASPVDLGDRPDFGLQFGSERYRADF
jgi:hypothetical protein